jgi:hypothetical protein
LLFKLQRGVTRAAQHSIIAKKVIVAVAEFHIEQLTRSLVKVRRTACHYCSLLPSYRKALHNLCSQWLKKEMPRKLKQ